MPPLFTTRSNAPFFYRNRDRFTGVMRYAIALNGSFFTAQRMLKEYVVKAYGMDAVASPHRRRRVHVKR
jgi:hypothetical protein